MERCAEEISDPNTAAKLPVTTGRGKWNSARQGPREGTYARIAHLNTLPQEKDAFSVPRFVTYGAPVPFESLLWSVWRRALIRDRDPKTDTVPVSVPRNAGGFTTTEWLSACVSPGTTASCRGLCRRCIVHDWSLKHSVLIGKPDDAVRSATTNGHQGLTRCAGG